MLHTHGRRKRAAFDTKGEAIAAIDACARNGAEKAMKRIYIVKLFDLSAQQYMGVMFLL